MTKTIDRPTTPRPVTTSDWMKLARAAALTMVTWAILLHIIVRTFIPPVFVVGLIFLGFAPFLKGERNRLGLAFAVVTVVALTGNLAGIADELANPDSAPAFILTLLSTVAALTAATAGLGAFFRWPTEPIRAIALTGIATFSAGTLASIAIAANTDSAPALGSDVTVTAEKVEFTPGEIVIDAGQAGVWMENLDGIRHTFTIEELGVDLEVPALKAGRIDIDAAPGTYQFVCSVPGHEAMTGTLVVEG